MKNIIKSIDYERNLEDKKGIKIFTSSKLTPCIHGFTTRLGGVSDIPYDSLNLSKHRPDNPENVKRNFHILCDAVGVKFEKMVLVNYEHGTNVNTVTKDDWGRGFDKEPLSPCDGLVTNDPDVVLVTLHADCVPLFFYDGKNQVIGLAHAGWRGMYGEIAKSVIRKMIDIFGSNKENINAVIGPCICKDCFEVDKELGMKFIEKFGNDCAEPSNKNIPDKMQVDLRFAAVKQMLDCGLEFENISIMDACTVEDKKLLFSHRRDKGRTGAMAAFIKL